MMLLQAKSAQKAPIALELGAKEGKDLQKNFSFMQLLQGFEQNDTAQKQTQTKPQEVKTLQTLLKNTDENAELMQDLELLDPKLVQNMQKSELIALMQKAKEYLKSQIEQSPEYKKAGFKELPQTLRSLVMIAQKLQIDISEISVQTQKGQTEIVLEGAQAKGKQEGVGQEIKPQMQAQTRDLDKQEIKLETKQELKTQTKELEKQEIKPETKQETLRSELAKAEPISQNKQLTLPLFKAQAATIASTEQLVQIKQIHTQSDEKELKSQIKTKDTLASLLRQDKEVQENPKLTADFSVAAAKVSAPKTAEQNATQSTLSRTLESLLHNGEESGSKTAETTNKIETQSPLKAESFEVKLNEAKQMIKFLSQDVRNAIEDYKSPFTRVKLQLNPQRLGELDLTIVQRGNNLHVNMSSNNAAINTLAMNMNELRTQFQNSGINNATFNFNSNSESFSGSADQGQQQQRQDQNKAHKEYAYLAEDETSEEFVRSLEIVVPRYI